jgi:hypothetical protein
MVNAVFAEMETLQHLTQLIPKNQTRWFNKSVCLSVPLSDSVFATYLNYYTMKYDLTSRTVFKVTMHYHIYYWFLYIPCIYTYEKVKSADTLVPS